MPAEKFVEHVQTTVESQLSRKLAIEFPDWYQQWLVDQKIRFN